MMVDIKLSVHVPRGESVYTRTRQAIEELALTIDRPHSLDGPDWHTGKFYTGEGWLADYQYRASGGLRP